MKYEKGPNKQPFIIIAGHWTAAAQILNPDMYSWLSDNLKTDDIIISIPHRDAMLAFPYCEEEEKQNQIICMVKEMESDGEKT